MTTTMMMTTAITNVPKREESRAKRHFQQIAFNDVLRWKCKYCTKNYGLNTSTTSLWKHLEKSHPEKLTAEDTKQKSGNERHHCPGKPGLESDRLSDSTAVKRLHVDVKQAGIYAAKDAEIFQPEGTTTKTATIGSLPDDLKPFRQASDKRKHSLQPDSTGEQKKEMPDATPSPSSDIDDPCRQHLSKRLATTTTSTTGNDVVTFHSPSPEADVGGYGFDDLLSDVVSLRPSELERFQDVLLQHAILQRWSTGAEPESRIMVRQRDRVVQTLLDECGWKFDMNVYPVSLFGGRQHLVLDLVYRKPGGEHRACFLDCVELPDEYPMELLSIVVFRKLCEFRVEDKLWQVFVGSARLRRLADILRNIFRENSLGEELHCETVDFSRQVFTVKQDEHEIAILEFLANLKECRMEIDKLQQLLGWIRNDGQQHGDTSWAVVPAGQEHQGAAWELPDGQGVRHQAPQDDSLHPTIRQDHASSNHRPDDNLVTVTVLRAAEQLQLLRHKLRPFRQEVNHIRRWMTDHLFIAHHMCSYCYYVCNEVNQCRIAGGSARFYLSDLFQQLSGRHLLASDLAGSGAYDAAGGGGVQATAARLRGQLHSLVFRDHRLDCRLEEWDGALAGWLDTVEQYRRLREAVGHHVMAADSETSTFARHFEKASRHVPSGVSEERWMKFVHWKIWRDFDR